MFSFSDYAYSPAFDSADFLRKEAVTSETLNVKKLAVGRIDLFVMDRYVFRHLIEKFPEYQNSIEPLVPALHTNPVHMLFSKEAEGVESKIEAFNQGLESIKQDGALQRIVERHIRPRRPLPFGE